MVIIRTLMLSATAFLQLLPKVSARGVMLAGGLHPDIAPKVCPACGPWWSRREGRMDPMGNRHREQVAGT